MSVRERLNETESYYNSIDNSRKEIISALEEKGVSTTSTLRLSEVNDKIREIETKSKDVYLPTGKIFLSTIKTLESSPTSIIFTEEKPPTGKTTLNLGVDSYMSTENPTLDTIVAWNDDTTIYVSGKGNNIIANQNCSNMFYQCSSLMQLDLDLLNTSFVTNMNYMFGYSSKLTELNLENFNTEKVENMGAMFANCTGLKSLNVSSFNTSKVITMISMFSSCSLLESLDISSFNTSKVTTMSSMFSSCSSLKSLDLKNFNTSSVTNMSSMFASCSLLESLNIENFNTSSVSWMGSMFYKCSQLTELDLSNFNTSKVTDMYGLFSNCSSLESLNIKNFNTSSVTDIANLFYQCSQLKELDLSNFNVSKVNSCNSIFNGCSNLEVIIASDWTTNGTIRNNSSIFDKCTSLKEFNSTKSGSKACLISQGGYFTPAPGAEEKGYVNFAYIPQLIQMASQYVYKSYNAIVFKEGFTSTSSSIKMNAAQSYINAYKNLPSNIDISLDQDGSVVLYNINNSIATIEYKKGIKLEIGDIL